VTDPHAFLGSPEDDFAIHPETVRERSAQGERSCERFILGAFEPALAGFLGFYREERRKLRHGGHLWGFYVAPEQRGRRLGAALLAEAIERARAMQGVERVALGVSTRSEAARQLYERAGFRRFGTEPRFLKLDDEYLDEHLMCLDLRTSGPRSAPSGSEGPTGS
jgi:ribosomal protein S18 acetylase RimI-like enzyme